MFMDYKITEAQAIISPPPRFNITSHRLFRETCKMLMEQPAVGQLIIDFREVEYIDSSVLGSLIYIKELFEKKGGTVKIAHAHGSALQILKIAAFDEIFEMI